MILAGFGMVLAFAAVATLVAIAPGLMYPLRDIRGLDQLVDSLPAVLITATISSWVVLGSALLAMTKGRMYLRRNVREIGEDNLRGQPNNLTIAGLVFAGFAVTQAGSDTSADTTLLIGSLSAFLIAWSVLHIPSAVAATYLADAMHWIGLALLVGFIFEVSHAGTSDVAVVASGGALVTVFATSLIHARGHFRSALGS